MPSIPKDQQIRQLAPFIMRATKCTRRVAIEFLCALDPDHLTVVRALKMMESLNKPLKSERRTRTKPPSIEPWCKPR